jgi:hypothetical protein
MRRVVFYAIVIFAFTVLGLGATFWYQTQPVAIVHQLPAGEKTGLPEFNRRILQICERSGEAIAPTYAEAVCTEFVIAVLDSVRRLSAQEKRDVRIITENDLVKLVREDAPIIRGVANALAPKGNIIASSEVLPGDLVQMWSLFGNQAFGHCGVVTQIVPGESLTLYSSHPVTSGFGQQTFNWPDKVYFVRLK